MVRNEKIKTTKVKRKVKGKKKGKKIGAESK